VHRGACVCAATKLPRDPSPRALILTLTQAPIRDLAPKQTEPKQKSVEARIRSAHLLLHRRLEAGLAQERGRTSLAASAASEVDVYFGGGCFWHMQHAFVQVAPLR